MVTNFDSAKTRTSAFVSVGNRANKTAQHTTIGVAAFLGKYFMKIVIRGISARRVDFPNLVYRRIGSEFRDGMCIVGVH